MGAKFDFTLAAVVAGMIIQSTPVSFGAAGTPILIGVSTGLYTVPSLALFPLLVPFTGLSATTVVIGLGLYALTVLVRAILEGLRAVPDDVRESARGMGMSGWQQFRRAELPLALPLVMSGVRLALVQVWATATIAALVAGPGLGRVITDGFFRTDYGKGIAGAIVVAAVALVLELLAAAVQRSLDPVRRAARTGEGEVSAEVSTLGQAGHEDG